MVSGKERAALLDTCAKFRDTKPQVPWLSVAESCVWEACDDVATEVAGAGPWMGALCVTLWGFPHGELGDVHVFHLTGVERLEITRSLEDAETWHEGEAEPRRLPSVALWEAGPGSTLAGTRHTPCCRAGLPGSLWLGVQETVVTLQLASRLSDVCPPSRGAGFDSFPCWASSRPRAPQLPVLGSHKTTACVSWRTRRGVPGLPFQKTRSPKAGCLSPRTFAFFILTDVPRSLF